MVERMEDNDELFNELAEKESQSCIDLIGK